MDRPPAVTVPAGSAGIGSIPERFHAIVHAGAATTQYARAGCGEPVVLLLTRRLTDDTAGSALFAELSRSFKVIAPELPGREYPTRADELREVATWLRDCMDGLGMDRAWFVMDEELALPTLGFTLPDPARLCGIVLLSRQELDPTPELEVCMHALTQTHATVLRYRLSLEGLAASDRVGALPRFFGAI